MTVIVTGAAGTIGREVCLKLVEMKVGRLVLVDIAETPLFWLERELLKAGAASGAPLELETVITSVANRDGIVRLFHKEMPQAVIHCAALKHVAMCERNVCEAILTNLWGSWVVVENAAVVGAKAVLVSTDKAVEPTTIMGQTKHLAERVAAGFSNTSIVRLVNIRGSNGSVIPVFERQIASGGPVTVTDPAAARFFMDASEAASMIIGEIVGPPSALPRLVVPPELKAELIMDLAKRMIAEAGAEIAITFTGLTAGEKLRERVMTAAEFAQVARGTNWITPTRPSWEIGGAVQNLMAIVGQGDADGARDGLRQIVDRGF